MPNSAFIVHLEIDDLSMQGLLDAAGSIHDSLEHAGLGVLDVAPWQHASLTNAAPAQQVDPSFGINLPLLGN